MSGCSTLGWTSTGTLVAALALAGCGSSAGAGGAPGGAAGVGAQGGSGASAGSGGAGASGGSSGSAGSGASAGSGGSAGNGGSAGSGGTPSCDPTPGTDAKNVSCDEVRIAVIAQPSGPPQLQVRARLYLDEQNDCVLVDSIELGEPGNALQTIDAGGVRDAGNYNENMVQVDAANAVSSLCQDETKRIEPFGFTVNGRINGGTFVASCGPTGSGSMWPPAVVLTCHSGIADQPFGADLEVEEAGAFTDTNLFVAYRHPAGQMEITSVGSSVRFVPSVDGWSSTGPIDPFDTSDWDGSASETTISGQAMSQVQLMALKDQLGPEACPVPPDPNDPNPSLPPVLIAKLGGTTSAGPFTSEVFVPGCMRVNTSGAP